MRYFETLNNARDLRKQHTDAEKFFWEKVRKRRLGGLKFNRQFIIEYFEVSGSKLYYIADFHNYQHKLIIELDGEIHHFQKDYDIERQINIEALGYKVLRFPNEEVFYSWEGVEQKILNNIRLVL